MATQADAVAACEQAQEYQGVFAAPLEAQVPFEGAEERGQVSKDLAERLDQALSKAADQMSVTELTAALITKGGDTWTLEWSRRSDPGDLSPRRFWWASVGKTFTAMAVMQLVEEGKLGLDDPIEGYLPALPNASLTTPRHLLEHTSGFYSFNEDQGLRNRVEYTPPEALLGVAASRSPLFCPGSYWSYSNSGYVALGLIIEQIDDREFHEAMEMRILVTPQTPSLRGMAPRRVPDDLVRPSERDLTTPFAAAGVIGTSIDVARAWRRFMRGEIVRQETADLMLERLYPMFGNQVQSYGLGIMVYRLPGKSRAQGDVWLGHSGGTDNSKSLVIWSREHEAVVAVSMVGNGSAESTVFALLDVLE